MRVCIYNRCSTEEENQKNALVIQAQESREIVEKKGWILVRQYVESQSGTTAYRRNEYQKMLSDMETDLFDVVVVKSIDRLTRSAKDWYLFLDRLMQNDKKLFLYIEQKFYTPDDNLLAGIKAILAEDFSRELSKKIKNAHRRRQEKRLGYNITVPIFGWDKVEKDVYVLNDEEARAYRLAFSMAEEGKGFYTIAKTMYDKGVRSKRGGRISEVQWRKMLQSPRAHGDVILHRTEYDFETKKKKQIPESEWVVIEEALPPIVSKEYQDRVLEILRQRTKNNHFVDYTRDMTRGGLYALSGKIYCAECGAVYYRSKMNVQRQKVVAWKCSTYLKQGKASGCKNIAVLEEEIIKAVETEYTKYIGDVSPHFEDVIRDAMELLQKVICQDVGSRKLEQLEKKLKRLQGKKSQLFEKWLDEGVDDEEYLRLNRELLGKIEMLHMEKVCFAEKREEYCNSEERLQVLKAELENETLKEAFLRIILIEVDKIKIFSDGRLLVQFQ